MIASQARLTQAVRALVGVCSGVRSAVPVVLFLHLPPRNTYRAPLSHPREPCERLEPRTRATHSLSAQHRPRPVWTAPRAVPVHDSFMPPRVRASSADQTLELEVAHPIERASM